MPDGTPAADHDSVRADAALPSFAEPPLIGVIGGSGLYQLFAEPAPGASAAASEPAPGASAAASDPAPGASAAASEPDANPAPVTLSIPTPFGATSSPITVGRIGGRTVAFLTRHGADHSVAPHLINYRANIWALKSLGVRAIISSAAVGGVSPDVPPGTLVLTDQFIDRTWGRPDTFFDRGSVQHLAAADPFCPTLHSLAVDALTGAGEVFSSTGTVVVIQGPRFSTRAESLWFRAAGAHTVNMTLVPEVTLAAELNIGTVNLSFVTDADAGLAPQPRERQSDARQSDAPQSDAPQSDAPQSDAPQSVAPQRDAHESDDDSVSAELVFRRLREAQPRIIRAIETIVRSIQLDYEPRELIAPAEVQRVLDYPLPTDPTAGAPTPAATTVSDTAATDVR